MPRGQVWRPGVHAGEILVQPAVAVKGGAVVASLLHQTHQALVHHLFLETAHERGESLDAERLGVRGRVLRRLQRRQRKRNLRHHHPSLGDERDELLVAIAHAHGDARHVVQAFHARRSHQKSHAVVPVARVSLRVQTEVRRREKELLEDIRLRGAVADGANRRGRPQVGRNLDEIAKARDAHTVAHADGDARRGLASSDTSRFSARDAEARRRDDARHARRDARAPRPGRDRGSRWMRGAWFGFGFWVHARRAVMVFDEGKGGGTSSRRAAPKRERFAIETRGPMTKITSPRE